MLRGALGEAEPGGNLPVGSPLHRRHSPGTVRTQCSEVPRTAWSWLCPSITSPPFRKTRHGQWVCSASDPITGSKALQYVWRSVRQAQCGLLAHLEVLVLAELADCRVDEIPHLLHGLRLPKADGFGVLGFENVLCRTMPAGNSLAGGVAARTACRNFSGSVI